MTTPRGRGPMAISFGMILLPVAMAAAQDHRHGWVATTYGYSSSVTRVSPNGVITTLYSSLPGASTAVTMDLDNRGYVVAPHGSALLRLDRSGVLVQSIAIPGATSVNEVLLHPSGDYLVISNHAGRTSRLSRVDRTTLRVTTLWTQPFYTWTLARDLDTGDLLTVDPPHLYRIHASTGAVSTIATVGYSISSQITQDLQTGGILLAGTPSTVPLPTPKLVRVEFRPPSVTVLRTIPSSLTVVAGRASSARQIFTLGALRGVYAVDSAALRLATIGSFGSFEHIVPEQGRNLATESIGTNRWAIRLDVSEDASRPFVIGLSLSSTRPAVPLSDGRRIPLAIDPITIASARGGIAGVLTGTVGVLSASGRAVATLDLSRFGPLPGLRLWIVALTFDPAAPLGVRTIVDPILLNP